MNQKSEISSETIPPLAWIILGLLALTWGSSFILIKKGLVAFSPQQIAGLRISIAFVAFLPVIFQYRKKIDWSNWKALVLVGFFGSFFPAFLFPIAQTHLSSSVAGVLGALTPLFTLFLGLLFFKFPISKRKMIGVIVGFMGAGVLVLSEEGSGTTTNVLYGLYVVLATFMYATTNNVLKAKLQNMSSVATSAASFLIIGIPGLITLFSSGFVSVLETHPHGWTSFGYVVILSLFSTVMATLLYFKLIQLTTPIFGSMVNYLVPVVALSWGLWDGEILVLMQIFGMILILFGIYISRK